MTEKEEQIAAAAIRVFARYGGKRSTMEDVAAEVAMSRQTLYRLFPNKDALMQAAIRYYVEQQWRGVHAQWARCAGLPEKLDVLFEQLVVVAWTVVSQSPDAAELEKGFNDAGREEIQRCAELSKSYIRELLETNAAPRGDTTLTDFDLADFIYAAMAGIKDDAQDVAQIRKRIAVLKAAVLGMVG